MNPDLYIVRKVNEATSISRKASLFMDLVTRYGHWAFVIYGLLLWFAPGEGRKARRLCCVLSFAGSWSHLSFPLPSAGCGDGEGLLYATGASGISPGIRPMHRFPAITR